VVVRTELVVSQHNTVITVISDYSRALRKFFVRKTYPDSESLVTGDKVPFLPYFALLIEPNYFDNTGAPR
jgi:hypothetical protein